MDRSYFTEDGFRFVIRNDMESEVSLTGNIEVDKSCIEPKLKSINNQTNYPIILKPEDKANFVISCKDLKGISRRVGFCKGEAVCRLSTTIEYIVNDSTQKTIANSLLTPCRFKE